MKKRIHLLLLSLILVFSIFPACGVSAKELYDFQIGFTICTSRKNPTRTS